MLVNLLNVFLGEVLSLLQETENKSIFYPSVRHSLCTSRLFSIQTRLKRQSRTKADIEHAEKHGELCQHIVMYIFVVSSQGLECKLLRNFHEIHQVKCE